MSIHWKSLLAACLLAIASSRAIAQTDPYKPPLYWSAYEYNIIRQHLGVCYNYLPETDSAHCAYYHSWRTHLSLGKDAPDTRRVRPRSEGQIVEIAEVGGLHHHYERRAA
jgi:hypothetical protein